MTIFEEEKAYNPSSRVEVILLAKRFVAKKKKKHYWKYLFYVFIIYFVYQVTIGVLGNLKLATSNEEFLKALLQDSNHLMLYEKSSKNIVNRISTLLSNIDLSDPLTILENSFHYKSGLSESIVVHSDDYSNVEELETITSHIKDPNPTENNSPRVYIYNSHQLENYSQTNLEAYNITPNVMMASYILKEKLNDLGIPTIAEEADITEFMRINSWNYNNSYKASRYYIEAAKEQNPTLEFYIDVHRDAINKSTGTITMNEKNYARILFVVGTDHDNYEANLELAKQLNSMVNEKYPGLSRGIITHGGKGYNGIYNQDFSPNMILLECGGPENTIDEVLNTMEVFAGILKDYLGE